MRHVLALSVVALISAALAAPAFAHAAYEGSDPDNGSTVSQPPSRVIADFTERLNPDASSLSVFDPCGTQVDGRDSLIANDRITISMSADKQGTYVVRFAVLSAVDGHTTSGQFGFTSSGGQPCPEEPGEEEEKEPQDPQQSEERTNNEDASGTEDRQDLRATGAGDQERREARANDRSSREDTTTREKRDRPGDPVISAPSAGVDLEADETSIWDGIPIGDFLIALAVAALIGAAGGRIYAGIIGPRR